MLFIKASSTNDAWKKTFLTLYNEGNDINTEKYFRDEPVVIEISNPKLEPADPNFPMSQQDLDVINNYIVTGKSEDLVVHEWTKLYRHRAFDQPYSQIEFMIDKLKTRAPVGETLISMWEKEIDQLAQVSPCTQVLWARIKDGSLEFHVHAHSSDAYKKLLMNLLEFIALQHYIAERIEVPVGKYLHFIDSCHMHLKDTESIEDVKEKLSSTQ